MLKTIAKKNQYLWFEPN